MASNEDLVKDYVQKYKAQGYSNDQIRQALLNSGIDPKIISGMIGSGKSFFKRWYFWIPLILIVIFLGLVGWFYFTEWQEGAVIGEEVTTTGEEVTVELGNKEVGECAVDNDCGAGYYCLSGSCIVKEAEEGKKVVTTTVSHGSGGGGGSSGGGSSGGGSSGGGSAEPTVTLKNLGESCNVNSDCSSPYVCDNYACATETECNDLEDENGDGEVDYTGGCDTTGDGVIDYVCGCFNTVTMKYDLYSPYSEDVCDMFGAGIVEYACSSFESPHFVSESDVDLASMTDFCADALSGVYYNPDSDCVDNTIDKEDSCGSGLDCVDSGCNLATGECVACSDSDDGKDILVRGSTSGVNEKLEGVSSEDFCPGDDSVMEYYCESNMVYGDEFDCGAGYICSDGACIVDCESYARKDDGVCYETCATNSECASDSVCLSEVCVACSDSDMGEDLYKKGVASGIFATTNEEKNDVSDLCMINGNLAEYFCLEQEGHDYLYYRVHACPSGYTCSDGVCIEEVDCGVYAVQVDGTCYNYCDYLGDEDKTTNIGCAEGYYCNSDTGSCEIMPVASGCASETDCAEGEVCSAEGNCLACVDSDEGEDVFVKGTISGVALAGLAEVSYEDSCDGEFVLDYFCQDNYVEFSGRLSCNEGYSCSDGACVFEGNCDDGIDNDGDGGIDYYGTCTLDGGLVYLCDESLVPSTFTAGPYKENCYFSYGDGTVGYCDDLDTAVFNSDADCSSADDTEEAAGPAYAAEMGESFFVKFLRWLMFWD